MGRTLTFNPLAIPKPTPKPSSNILETLKLGDVVTVTCKYVPRCDENGDEKFTRQCSSYCHIPGYIVNNETYIVEAVDVDQQINEVGLVALLLVPVVNTAIYYMVEYVTTDGYIRNREDCKITGHIVDCILQTPVQ